MVAGWNCDAVPASLVLLVDSPPKITCLAHPGGRDAVVSDLLAHQVLALRTCSSLAARREESACRGSAMCGANQTSGKMVGGAPTVRRTARALHRGPCASTRQRRSHSSPCPCRTSDHRGRRCCADRADKESARSRHSAGLHLAADGAHVLGGAVVAPQREPVKIHAAVSRRVVLKESAVLLVELVDLLVPVGRLLLPVGRACRAPRQNPTAIHTSVQCWCRKAEAAFLRSRPRWRDRWLHTCASATRAKLGPETRSESSQK